MASVISASRTRYGTLTAANFPDGSRPALYFDEAPLVEAHASDHPQVFPPYVVLRDEGLDPDYEFELAVVEVSRLSFEAFADTLEDVDLIAEAIKYNGGAVGAGLGFDFGSLSGLPAGAVLKEYRRTGERRYYAGVGKSGQRVHACKLDYRVTVQRG